MVATYYEGSKHKLADGTRYSEHSMFAAAPRRYKLGRKIRLACAFSGRVVTVTIRDYGPKNMNHFDLSETAFRKLVGPKYHIIGKVKVKVKEI